MIAKQRGFVVSFVALAWLSQQACSDDATSGSPPMHAAAGETSAAGEGSSAVAGSGGVSAEAGAASAGEPSGGTPMLGGAGGQGGEGTAGEAGAAAVVRCPDGPNGTLACVNPRLLVGAAVNPDLLQTEPYAGVLLSEMSYITPENVMKWEVVQPTAKTWDFSQGDRLLAYAEEHGMPLKAHTLIWHVQRPTWTNALSGTALVNAVEAHVTRAVTHYRGRVRAWDVVNEAVLDSGAGLRPGLHTALGVAGMARAFKLAREADPDAALYYNDYEIESLNDKSDAVYRLLQELLAAGAPIDGVGFQSHFSTKRFPSLAALRENIKRFAALGLTVNISELDVRTSEVPGTKRERAEAQAIVYRDTAAACALEPACDALTIWGITDAHSWIDEQFGEDDPLPWDEAYAKKPAYRALLLGLDGRSAKGGAELLADGGCETGNGWAGFGGGTLSFVANGRTGNACRTTMRTEPHHGPSVSLTGKIPHGSVVTVTAYARLAAAGTINMLLKKVEPSVDDEYRWLAGRVVDQGEWTLLSANFTLGYGASPSELTLFFDSPAVEGQLPNLLVDDVSVKILTE